MAHFGSGYDLGSTSVDCLVIAGGGAGGGNDHGGWWSAGGYRFSMTAQVVILWTYH